VTGPDVGGLLAEAAARAELDAPAVDPVAAVARARRRREQRRGHAAVLAFVAFVLLLQLAPAEALGADRSTAPAVALVSVSPVSRG
jgi:ferric-dicitrate binding protein FerR (iron transport regulator)